MESETDSRLIIHIPGKLPVQPDQQPTVNVIASVIEPKLANSIVRRLNQIAPLENLRHVKRVRKTRENGKVELSVVLCLAPEEGKPTEYPNIVEELITSHSLRTFTAKVCKYAASTKEEWEEQCKFWPTSFHPPTYNIDGITGFSDDDTQSVVRHMKYVIELAKSRDNLVVNAAVIVDPASGQVIAAARDEVFQLANNAQNFPEPRMEEDSDGLLSSSSREEQTSSVGCFYPWKWADNKVKNNFCLRHPLRHAALVAIEMSAARDMRLFPTVESSSIAMSPQKKQRVEEEVSSKKEGEDDCASEKPYLCTGYDIYLVWEPCAMCAMALVHQRVKRIFFALPNPSAGGLGSVHRLQGEKSLNHHYAVFRVLLFPEQEQPDLVMDQTDRPHCKQQTEDSFN